MGKVINKIDNDLISSNIKNGVDIFGVVWNYNWWLSNILWWTWWLLWQRGLWAWAWMTSISWDTISPQWPHTLWTLVFGWNLYLIYAINYSSSWTSSPDVIINKFDGSNITNVANFKVSGNFPVLSSIIKLIWTDVIRVYDWASLGGWTYSYNEYNITTNIATSWLNFWAITGTTINNWIIYLWNTYTATSKQWRIAWESPYLQLWFNIS